MTHPLAIEELDRIDALRPPCPTCGGTEHVPFSTDNYLRGQRSNRCPDCVDGKVSIEQLVATYNAVQSLDPVAYEPIGLILRSVKP